LAPEPPLPLAFEFLTVGSPGNGAAPLARWDSVGQQDLGDVAYTYEIAKYETTIAQWAEFLNAVATGCFDVGAGVVNDPYKLFIPGNGIEKTGSDECPGANVTYEVQEGRDNFPAQGISFNSAIRFVNWHENGKPLTPTIATEPVSKCKNELRDQFRELNSTPLAGCQGGPFVGTPTTTDGAGIGLTLTTRFNTFSTFTNLIQIFVEDAGSGYQVGDTITVEAGSICSGSTESTITLTEENFRTVNDSTTEDGYALLCVAEDQPGTFVTDSQTRNDGVEYMLPTEDEWYKAAYFAAMPNTYYTFPFQTDDEPTCACAGDSGSNSSNCDSVEGLASEVGRYSNSMSPFGALDMGGNMSEWVDESIANATCASARVYRGGGFYFDNRPTINYQGSVPYYNACAGSGFSTLGFRMARCPVPGTCNP